MIYTANITTAVNTSVVALQKTVIRVTKGLVYKVEFNFPPGSSGLMGVAVFDGLYQVWPSSVGEFFIGDDVTIAFDDMYLKGSAPFEFQAYTYNVDDTYEHFVAVRIGLVSSDMFMARFMPTRGRERFVILRERMERDREERARAQRLELPETAFAFLSAGVLAEAEQHRAEVKRHEDWLQKMGLE